MPSIRKTIDIPYNINDSKGSIYNTPDIINTQIKYTDICPDIFKSFNDMRIHDPIDIVNNIS
ncbi:hypothetical protein D3C76_1803060 [compost metagenome]